MKIINRLYFKTIVIATVLIISIVEFYYLHDLKNIAQKKEMRINKLNLEVVNYQKKLKYFKNLKKKVEIKKVEIIKTKIKKIYITKKSTDKYKKMIMYNVHNQILQELKYAPYLPVSQLQEMMDNRFVLNGIKFRICICENINKPFKGIKVEDKITKSIIRDNELLEIRFDTK